MVKVGFAVPVLPGKEDLATIHSIEEIRRRMPEYEESRHRAGVIVERVYLQGNPDGSKLFVIYVEAAGDTADVLGTFATSGSDFDRWFLDVNQEITGIDFRQPAPGGGPEHIASWAEPGGSRGAGLAFAAPLLPGKAEGARAWAGEAFESRRRELTESRLALGQTREEVFLNSSPAGDVCVAMVLAAASSLALDLRRLRGQPEEIARHSKRPAPYPLTTSGMPGALSVQIAVHRVRACPGPSHPARRLPGRKAGSGWYWHGADLDKEPKHVGLGEALDAPAAAEMQNRNAWQRDRCPGRGHAHELTCVAAGHGEPDGARLAVP
jgi:hypothetical protein